MLITPLAALLPTFIGLLIGFFRRDLRREMFWAGLLSIPITVTPFLLFGSLGVMWSGTESIPLFLMAGITAFFFGADAAALYEVFLRKHLVRNEVSVPRKELLWLLVGPAVYVLAAIFLPDTWHGWALVVALLLDLAVVLIVRRDLIWDAIFSGLAMSVLYLVMYIVVFSNYRDLADHTPSLPELVGITFRGIPLEELIGVGIFGALWGPLYAAIKGFRES